jgi:phosphopantothenate-cysteine ligase
LKHGFAVIFLYRKASLRPFEHEIQSLSFVDDSSLEEAQNLLAVAFRKFQQFKSDLLQINYFSVADYLFLLSEASKRLAPLKNRILLFLAAAVSDFYLDDTFISEHKISTSNTGLCINLSPVPKFIKLLKEELIPEACIISFKLETEESLVLQKAKDALERYGHDLVVANVLASRKEKVWIVHRGGRVDFIAKTQGPIEIDLVSSLLKINKNQNIY